MKVEIDIARRYAKQRAHTATHLLHVALQKYFPMTKQEWSFVWEDELRFDFAADALLSNKDLDDITEQINHTIYQALPVVQKTMKYDDAIASGAKAFFADTYGDEVRVVSVWDAFSVELCGWNHVENTSDIGAFVIDSQEAVAAWIKRIHAYTWPRVVQKIVEYTSILDPLLKTTWLKQASQLPEKIDKLLKEHQDAQKINKQLKQEMLEMIATHASAVFQSPVNINSIIKIFPVFTWQDILSFLENSENYKKTSWITYVDNDDDTSVVTIYDPIEWHAKEIAKKLWVQWGWTDKKITGKLQTHFIILQ